MNERSFQNILRGVEHEALSSALSAVTSEDVECAIAGRRLADSDAIRLFSPAATEHLESMAQGAAAITERRFGKTIQLYAPLYLSNECANTCLYCGFSAHLDTPRLSLTLDESLEEAERLHEMGFRHILLVTGEARGRYGVDRIVEVIRRLTGDFSSISIEAFPMDASEYRRLMNAGADGLTLYQETYDPRVYAALHPKGPKSRYHFRVSAIEKGGEAGFRSLGIGALLGLADWRIEAVILAWHARFLSRRFWRSRISVSFPRVNGAEATFTPPEPVSDAALVQMITGMRLLLPDAELVVSTRESAALRDSLVGLGVTRMSAGSKTNPGGYATQPVSVRQFNISDERSPREVAAMLEERGFEPVWKDFDPIFSS